MSTRPVVFDSLTNAPIEERFSIWATNLNSGVQRLTEGVGVSVKDFRAKGDGVTDDTAAIAAAVDAVSDAGGGTVVFPMGTYLVSDVTVLDGLSNVTLVGMAGAALTRTGSSTTGFFQVVGCTNVTIRGFRLVGASSATTASTGSSPPILVGSTSSGETRHNNNIVICDNRISGANWGGIVIYGKHGTEDEVKNIDIRVFNNYVTDCSGIGIFVYKNAQRVTISNNIVYLMGQDSIALDTRAASDSQDTEANFDIVIANNVCVNAGRGAQGIGILAKGDNRRLVIADNVITDTGVSQPSSLDSYGILVNQDFGGAGPTQPSITGNVISNVTASGTNGYGIFLGGATGAVVTNNTIDTSKTYGIYVFECTIAKVADNVLNNVTGTGGYGIRVDGTDASHKSTYVDVTANKVFKGSGSGTVGVYFGYSDNCRRIGNDVVGFAAANASTADATNLVVGDAVDASLVTGNFSGGVTVTGGAFAQGRLGYTATAGTILCGKTGSANDLTLYGTAGVPIFANPTGTNDIKLGTNTDKVGFFGTAGTTVPTVTGSRGGNAALASLLTKLAALGLLVDSSS